LVNDSLDLNDDRWDPRSTQPPTKVFLNSNFHSRIRFELTTLHTLDHPPNSNCQNACWFPNPSPNSAPHVGWFDNRKYRGGEWQKLDMGKMGQRKQKSRGKSPEKENSDTPNVYKHRFRAPTRKINVSSTSKTLRSQKLVSDIHTAYAENRDFRSPCAANLCLW
jgi:hypothetical protein